MRLNVALVAVGCLEVSRFSFVGSERLVRRRNLSAKPQPEEHGTSTQHRTIPVAALTAPPSVHIPVDSGLPGRVAREVEEQKVGSSASVTPPVVPITWSGNAGIASASVAAPTPSLVLPMPANPSSPSVAWLGPTVVHPWAIDPVIPWTPDTKTTEVASANVDSAAVPVPAPLIPIPAYPADPTIGWIGQTEVVPWKVHPVIPWPVGSVPEVTEVASTTVDTAAVPVPVPVIPIPAYPADPSVAWIGQTEVTPWKLNPVIPWPVGSTPETAAIASATVDEGTAPVPVPVIPIPAYPADPTVAWLGQTKVIPWKLEPVIPWPVGSAPTTAAIASATVDEGTAPVPVPVIPIPAYPADPSVAWIGQTKVIPWKLEPVIPWPVGSSPTTAAIASATVDEGTAPVPVPVIPIPAYPADPTVAWIGQSKVVPWKLNPVIPWPVGSAPTTTQLASATVDSAPVPLPANPSPSSAKVIPWKVFDPVIPWPVGSAPEIVHVASADVDFATVPGPGPLVPIPANPSTPNVAWIAPTVVIPWEIEPVIPWTAAPIASNSLIADPAETMGVASTTIDNTEPASTVRWPTDSIPTVPVAWPGAPTNPRTIVSPETAPIATASAEIEEPVSKTVDTPNNVVDRGGMGQDSTMTQADLSGGYTSTAFIATFLVVAVFLTTA